MNYFRCGGGRSTHTATKIDVAKTPLATFQSNVSGLYIPEILAYIQATQSGTGDPSPSNPRPINGVSEVSVARTGVNLAAFTDGYGINASGVVITQTGRFATINPIPINPNISYYVQASLSGMSFIIAVFNGSTLVRRTAGITAGTLLNTSGGDKLYVCGYRATDITIADCNPMVKTTVDTLTYEAYTGNTATTALGGTYYGGYLNVTTGLLTITHKYIEYDGSADEDWTIASDGTQRIAAPNDMLRPDNTKSISNQAVITNSSTVGSGRFRIGSSNLIINAGTFADVTALKTYLASTNFQMVYTLATPQTVQLTPAQIEQILGQNNVFCSSGDVAVKCWKID